MGVGMFRVKNILLAIVVLAGAAYGGLKAYVYFQVKEQVDALSRTASPFARLSYDGIGSRLDGTVTIEGVRIEPHQLPDELRIDTVELETPGLGFVLSGSDSLQGGKLPKKMTLRVRGLRLDVDSPLFGMIQQAQQAQAADSGLACSPGQALGSEHYKALGFDTLVMDSAMGFDFTGPSGGVRLFMDYAMRGKESMHMEATVVGPTPSLGELMMRPQVLLTDLAVSYTVDPDFGERAVRHCAEASGMSPGQYAAAFANQDDATFVRQMGFVPGPGIRAALERFIKAPGSVRVRAHPATPVDLSTLAQYRPEDALRLLGMTVTVNDEAVDDLSLRLASLPGGGPFSALTGPQGRSGVSDGGDERGQPRLVGKFRPVGTAALSEHIGQNVRIYTRDGKRREGRLARIRDGEAAVEHHVHGGTMTVQVALDEIRRAEVWFYDKP